MTTSLAANLLAQTQLLDFGNAEIEALVIARGWRDLPTFDGIGAVYDFVRNEIRFGYNRSDDIPASDVLRDGYGQCNTKGTLLMALLRAISVPCRLHGFTIHKALQRGVVPELVYGIAPENILHSWVEIHYNDNWINLEGFILDDDYLAQIQQRFVEESDSLCGYGVGTNALTDPSVLWRGEDTYIQKTGINNDFGNFATPDLLYAEHQQSFAFWKGLIYRKWIRHWMNARVKQIRSGKIPIIDNTP